MRSLYYAPNSPYARKVRIVLAEKGLEYRPEAIDLANAPAEFEQSNPNMRVPCLIDAGQVLFESNSILDYLLATYPDATTGGNPPLARTVTRPEHPWEDRMVLDTIETVLDSGLLLFHMMRDGVNSEQAPSLKRDEARVQRGLDWLEARVTPEGYVPGVLSIQDLNLAVALLWADFRKPFAWRGRVNLEALVRRYEGRQSFQSTKPVG